MYFPNIIYTDVEQSVTLNAILAACRHTYDLLSVGNSRHSGSHTGSSFLFDY